MDKVLLTAKYVEGDISELEHMIFEEAINYDVELQEYLKNYRIINEELDLQLMDRLVHPEPGDAGNEEPYVAEKISYGLDRLWFFGWAIVLLAALFIWQPWKKSLVEEFSIANTSAASILDKAPYNNFPQAAQFVEDGDYSQAKLIVSKSYVKNPGDKKLGYYYGMVLIGDDCLETARIVLEPIANGTSVYKNEAIYLLALSYLKQDDHESCKAWLQKISQDFTDYQKSQKLLAGLNREFSV